MVLPRHLNAYSNQFWPDDKNTRIVIDKPIAADAITVVTAFFDIDRGNWNQQISEVSSKYRRTVDDYFIYFKYLANLKNEMVIFTDTHLAQRVLDMRSNAGLACRTIIFTIDRLLDCPEVRVALEAISRRMTDQFRGFVWRPTAPEYNKPDYVLINALKTTFACTAIERQVITTPQLAWIDFGYTRSVSTFDRDVEWRYYCGEKINLFNIFKLDERPIYDVVRGGEVYFQGCHFLGPVGAWSEFNHQLSDALVSLLDCGLIDDDQTLMLMAWRRSPHSFIVHHKRIDPELGWRFIFKRFRSGQPVSIDDLPAIRQIRQPDWWRDLKTFLRRKIRSWWRKYSTRKSKDH